MTGGRPSRKSSLPELSSHQVLIPTHKKPSKSIFPTPKAFCLFLRAVVTLGQVKSLSEMDRAPCRLPT